MFLKKSSGNLFLLFLFLLSPQYSFAKDGVKVTTTVNPKEVEVGERFAVVIEVAADSMVSVPPPATPTIDGARSLGVTRSQRVNAFLGQNEKGESEFQTVQTQTYNYVYEATKNGDLEIPSVVVEAGEKMVNSPPAKIKVWAAGVNRPRNQPQQRPSRNNFPTDPEEEDPFLSSDPFKNMQKMEEQFNQLLQRRFGGQGGALPGYQAVPPINEKDAFVIVAEVDKTEAFKGEQITASWYLYTKAGVREIDTLKYPDLKGFWKEDIELATLLNFQPAELNGQQYSKALLASYALFPIEAGKAVIDEYRAKVSVVGGFGKALTSTKNSQSIPVLVKPLPEAGKTALFSGAVGEFQLQAGLESKSVVAHQPFTIRVHLEGRGNAKQFELPNPQLPPDVELYDIKKESQFFKDGRSFKNFDILLIPRKEGELTIPPIVTSIFNPKTQKYQDLSTPEFKLTVMPGTGQQGMASSRLVKEGEAKDEVLLPISDWKPQKASSRVNPLLWALLFSIAVVVLFGYAALQLRWFQKPLTIKEKFQIRAKAVHGAHAKKDWRATGIEATNLAYYVLGEISGQGGANLQVEKLLEKAPPSVRRNIGEDLRKVMDKFYLLGFGPDEAVKQAAQVDLVKEDIKTLEKLLQKAIELSGTGMKE